jgi:cytochrome oxidase assembly protein ShyY1
MGMRLVADGAAPGLEPSALPSPKTIPNNHRFYAVQWFALALIALVIYGLAVSKKIRRETDRP